MTSDQLDPLTAEQIKNWRDILVHMIGPFALIMSDEMVEQFRDRMNTIINFGAYLDRVSESAPAEKPKEPELWKSVRIKLNLRNGALTVEQNGKEAYMLSPSSEEMLQQLPKDLQLRIKAQQYTKVNATVIGNVLLRVEA